jgi:hypothetical protein
MNRRDFQFLSRLRIREAKVLLDAGLFCGSYYLAGYSVECAFKAIISKRTVRYAFPDKALANQVHTHNLTQLMHVSQLAAVFERAAPAGSPLAANWKSVLAWQEHSRYILNTSAEDAHCLYRACADRISGVLPWLKNFW